MKLDEPLKTFLIYGAIIGIPTIIYLAKDWSRSPTGTTVGVLLTLGFLFVFNLVNSVWVKLAMILSWPVMLYLSLVWVSQ